LIESISIVNKSKNEIKKAPNEIGKIVYKKLATVLNKNEGFKIIYNISDILNGQDGT